MLKYTGESSNRACAAQANSHEQGIGFTWIREMLCCPHCRGSLRAASAGYSCCQCQATYPVRHGVPILIPGITVERSNFSVADDLITRICAAETIPDQPENRATLREIFAWNYRLDIWLTAENNYYLKRVGLNADGYRPKAPRMDRESVNGNICYEIPFHYIPATLPPGETRSWNVRLVNKGAGVLSPEGLQPVFLCYRWRDLREQSRRARKCGRRCQSKWSRDAG